MIKFNIFLRPTPIVQDPRILNSRLAGMLSNPECTAAKYPCYLPAPWNFYPVESEGYSTGAALRTPFGGFHWGVIGWMEIA